jgi:hypothetical protein
LGYNPLFEKDGSREPAEKDSSREPAELEGPSTR